ncbi:hypothetical protein B296_00002230 [Ensete ventricosum]|uniref:Uncharacterized protein n=1 Tax=Ensete ventricosum TaxID=4639 RepID=A0A427A5P2_ENSVE|nr:hypothetical protein B296_00002230 [Ensete ventricosum]
MPLIRQQKNDLNITNLEAYTMASKEAINTKFEAFKSHMEEKMRSLFTEFSMGRPPSPKKLQQGETSDWRDDPREHDNIIPDPNTSYMKVDFPRWEGDLIGWIACAECYFWFYRTVDATRVKMLFSGLIGMRTPMEVYLGNDSRKDY